MRIKLFFAALLFVSTARATLTPAGWISLYGELPGGTYFFTNLIGQQTETAQVSWDFTLPGYGMTDLLLFGRDGKAMRG